jgi:guanylate kinase
MSRGKLIVISAPSGAGKTTIVKALLAKHPPMLFSVSATTRPKRETEVEGRDYFFLRRQDFERRIAAGELVEWEEIMETCTEH